MATSPYDDTVLILDFLGRLLGQKAAVILDVGAGFGRWGFLCRCHLGFGTSLTVTPGQHLRIEAIEGFSANVTPIYDCVYDAAHVGDALQMLPGLGAYDVIICSHMLEHLPKDDGQRLLSLMRERARAALILAVPFGGWPQEAFGGNAFEKHRAEWEASDFAGPNVFIKAFNSRCRFGVVICAMNDEARWQVRMMKQPLRRWFFPAYRRLSAVWGRQGGEP